MTIKDLFQTNVIDQADRLQIAQELRQTETAAKLAPTAPADRLAFWQNRRAELFDKDTTTIGAICNDAFVADDFAIGPNTIAQVGRVLDIYGRKGWDAWPELRAWYVRTTIPAVLITKEINDLRDIAQPIPGIAQAFADYIGGTSDTTLTTIIRQKRLPDGTAKPVWKKGRTDAARWAHYAGMDAPTFNKIFSYAKGKPIQRQDINNIERPRTWKDEHGETPIKKIFDNLPITTQ